VTVPSGGVKQGQELVVPLATTPAETTTTATATTTARTPPQDGYVGGGLVNAYNTVGTYQPQEVLWRHKLCSWGDVCCSGLWWFACCCPALVMGQMLSRMNLDFCGSPAATLQQARDAFTIVLVVFLISALGNGLLPGLTLVFLIYSIVFGTRLRSYMRSRYRIPTSCCIDTCDDCCCVFWCGCCASIQMIRHTQPDDKHYDCCSYNGLRPGAPMVV
jgi:PLAC8 family